MKKARTNMVEQIDLFESASEITEEEKNKLALEEEIERLRNERVEFFTKNLTPRQHKLINYLETNFVQGKYFSIEDLCNADLGYELNTNPRTHDKCVSLGNDIRQINWKIGHRYSIIVKDKKGGCKLCESVDEFEEWKQSELKPLERKWKYLNNLTYKASWHDTAPLINLNNRTLEENEIEFVDVFKG